jgi:hypothetical protein
MKPLASFSAAVQQLNTVSTAPLPLVFVFQATGTALSFQKDVIKQCLFSIAHTPLYPDESSINCVVDLVVAKTKKEVQAGLRALIANLAAPMAMWAALGAVVTFAVLSIS